MHHEEYSEKEFLLKILRSELKRGERVKKLSEELDELENCENRNVERINEIVNELKIINPFPEEPGDMSKTFIKPVKASKSARRFAPLKISAACIIILISVQLISFTAFGTDLFGWTKDKFLALIGAETEQGDMSLKSSGLREYKTIEEFEKAENIDIMVPMWLPGDMEIEFVMYLHDYAKKQIIICYDKDITLLTIKLNSNISNTDGSEIYIANGFEFYIFKEASVIYWEYDGNFYSLTCGFDVGGYAEKIIENIK